MSPLSKRGHVRALQNRARLDDCAPGKIFTMRFVGLALAIASAAAVFGQSESETIPRDTGSDLLWKKLETRVEEIATRLDGVMGVAVLDLTDGRILLRNADRVFPYACDSLDAVTVLS